LAFGTQHQADPVCRNTLKKPWYHFNIPTKYVITINISNFLCFCLVMLSSADVKLKNYFVQGKGTCIDLNIALKIETNVLD